jgi:hypothetical protein
MGSSIFGGGAGLYLAYQLVRAEPARAYGLLNAWGPGYVLALVIAWALNKLLTRALEMAARSSELNTAAMDRVAEQMKSIAEAGKAQAAALQSTADRDDRDKQEMQILIGVVNSKVEQTLDELKQHRRIFDRIEDALRINRPEESGKQ